MTALVEEQGAATVPADRRLAAGATALVAASVVGGVVSVVSGVNTWSDAWTAEATLAAPWPMLLAQAAAGAGAVSRRPRVARGGTAALLLLALVSGISGFFDGQLARPDLGAAYVAMQWVYVVVAAAVVVLAGRRLRELRRSRPVGATAA